MTDLASAINLSPKQRFLQSKGLVTMHQAMVERDGFNASVDTAFLEYVRQVQAQTEANNQVGALAGYFRILGAQEFIAALKNLGLATVPSSRVPKTENLDHKA